MPTSVSASVTLIHWHNQTGTGTDVPGYPDKALRGRYNGEALYKNDNDPCIYDQQNIHEKGGNIIRGRARICNSKQESLRNPVIRFGSLVIPGVGLEV